MKKNLKTSKKNELHVMIENVPMAIFLVDKERKVRRSNVPATNLAGVKNNSLTGLRAGEALRCFNHFHNAKGCGFSPVCKDCLIRNTINKTFKKKRGFKRVEVKMNIKRSGKKEELTLLMSTSLVDVLNEKLCLVCFEDITKQKHTEKTLQKTKNYLEKLINHANAPIIVWNSQHKIVKINHAFEQTTGYSSEELTGKDLSIIFPKEKEGKFVRKILTNTEGKNKKAIEVLIRLKNGDIHTFIWSSANIYNNYYDKNKRKLVATIAQGQDIAELKRKEEEIIKLSRVLKAKGDCSKAVISSKDEKSYLKEICRIVVEECGYKMVWIGFAENDKEKSVRPVASAGFETSYLETLKVSWSADIPRGKGPSGTAIRTGKIGACRNMLTDPLFRPWRKEAIKRGYVSSIAFPLKMNGKVIGSLSVYSKESNPFSKNEIKILKELSDDVAYGITFFRLKAANKKAEEFILYSSTHDVLTGVYNRYFLEEQLQKVRKKKKFNGGVIMIDVNGLKKINDRLGHWAGDEAIKKTASFLVSRLRKKDMIARFGGDEFCVLLPNTNQNEVKFLANRLKNKNYIAKNNDKPSISVGSAYVIYGKDIDDAIKVADSEMYKDKFAEKNLQSRKAENDAAIF